MNEITRRPSRVGTLTTSPGGNLSGAILTRNVSLPIHFKTNEDRQGEKSPDFLVMSHNAMTGEVIQVGAAWNGKTRDDRHMLSIKLNDPDLPDWCQDIAAFAITGTKSYDIVA